MKDSEFIELLNLYVDQEISAADAARLEAEVQGNPARRQTYQTYCRMHKACKLLAQDFQTAPAAERKVVAFDPFARPAPRTGTLVGALGTLAAAACLAIIFVNRDRPVQDAPAFAAQEIPVQVQAPAIAGDSARRGIIHAVSVPPAPSARVGNPLLLSSRAHADAMLAAAAEQNTSQFAWMRSMQLSPLQPHAPLESVRFEPAVSPDGTRTYTSPRAAQEPVEWVAFKFQK